MSFGRLLKESLALGRKFPLIYLPILVVSLLVGLVTALFVGGFGTMPTAMVPGMGPGMGAGYAGAVLSNIGLHLASAIITGILIIVGHAVTVIMVGQALQLGNTSLGKGVEQARLRLVQLLIAAVVTAVLIGIGFVLFVLPGLIVGFFLLFTFVAVALEEYSAFGGVKKSFLVVKDRLGDAFVFFLLLIALGVLFALVNRILLFIPIVGGLVSLLLAGIYSGYVSTLVVLAYRELNPGGLSGPTEKPGPTTTPGPSEGPKPGSGPTGSGASGGPETGGSGGTGSEDTGPGTSGGEDTSGGTGGKGSSRKKGPKA